MVTLKEKQIIAIVYFIMVCGNLLSEGKENQNLQSTKAIESMNP